jgi:hypothetical protein
VPVKTHCKPGSGRVNGWKIKAPIIYFFAMLLTNIVLLYFSKLVAGPLNQQSD